MASEGLCTTVAYEQLGGFLNQYIHYANGELPPDCAVYKEAIKLLLQQKVFASKDEMRRECLKNFLFIIPDFMFE